MKGGPAPDDSPLSVAAIAYDVAMAKSGGARPPIVMDTVYNPLETRLLAEARAAGFRTIDGLSMFVRQAELQFRAWTGHEPASGSYETLARRALFADTPS
jgi:shikimate 5-dehydrogenase